MSRFYDGACYYKDDEPMPATPDNPGTCYTCGETLEWNEGHGRSCSIDCPNNCKGNTDARIECPATAGRNPGRRRDGADTDAAAVRIAGPATS